MNISAELLAILSYLIPGLIASGIMNAIIYRKEKDIFARIVEALIYSFIAYAIMSFFKGETPVQLVAKKQGDNMIFETIFKHNVMLPLLLLSIGMPVVAGFLIQCDIPMRILRFLGVSRRGPHFDIWHTVFTKEGKRRIVINLKDGRRVCGWPLYISDSLEDQSLYLYKPAYFMKNEQIQKLPIHGLFLVKKEWIESIEFLFNKQEKETINGTREGKTTN